MHVYCVWAESSTGVAAVTKESGLSQWLIPNGGGHAKDVHFEEQRGVYELR